MKLRDDILTSQIEVNFQSTDVADEEQLFLLPDEENELEQEIFTRKPLSQPRAIDYHETQLSTKVTEVSEIPSNSAVSTFGAIMEKARFRNEQDANPLLEGLILRILHEEYDKHLLKTEPTERKKSTTTRRKHHHERRSTHAKILRRKRDCYSPSSNTSKIHNP